MNRMKWSRVLVTGAVLSLDALFPLKVAAKDLDINELLAAIDERSGQYDQLIEILQGPDPSRALAAFDVMLATNDKTLRETAIAAAFSATDERLRARALWETLMQKDSVTLSIDTAELDDEASSALDNWIGAISNWAVFARFPDTQCLNLYRGSACEEKYHMSVSGLQVDLRYQGVFEARVSLNSESILVGEVTNPNGKAVFPVSIQLR